MTKMQRLCQTETTGQVALNNGLDYSALVKYKGKYPCAVAYKIENIWEIWVNFTRPDIVIGTGHTQIEAWRSAWQGICRSEAV